LRLHAKYPGTANSIAVEKHSRQLERNDDGCAFTAKLHLMVDGKHFGEPVLASMSMCMIVYTCSLSKVLSACNTRQALEGLAASPTNDSFMQIPSRAKLAAATVLAIFAITLLASGQYVEGT
jgi:hypothetical protein